mgnify:CR=1 FL=1
MLNTEYISYNCSLKEENEKDNSSNESSIENSTYSKTSQKEENEIKNDTIEENKIVNNNLNGSINEAPNSKNESNDNSNPEVDIQINATTIEQIQAFQRNNEMFSNLVKAVEKDGSYEETLVSILKQLHTNSEYLQKAFVNSTVEIEVLKNKFNNILEESERKSDNMKKELENKILESETKSDNMKKEFENKISESQKKIFESEKKIVESENKIKDLSNRIILLEKHQILLHNQISLYQNSRDNGKIIFESLYEYFGLIGTGQPFEKTKEVFNYLDKKGSNDKITEDKKIIMSKFLRIWTL